MQKRTVSFWLSKEGRGWHKYRLQGAVAFSVLLLQLCASKFLLFVCKINWLSNLLCLFHVPSELKNSDIGRLCRSSQTLRCMVSWPGLLVTSAFGEHCLKGALQIHRMIDWFTYKLFFTFLNYFRYFPTNEQDTRPSIRVVTKSIDAALPRHRFVNYKICKIHY